MKIEEPTAEIMNSELFKKALELCGECHGVVRLSTLKKEVEGDERNEELLEFGFDGLDYSYRSEFVPGLSTPGSYFEGYKLDLYDLGALAATAVSEKCRPEDLTDPCSGDNEYGFYWLKND